MRSFVALSVILLATSPSASSAITGPLKKEQDNGAYLKGARAPTLNFLKPSGLVTVPLTRKNNTWYTTRVVIGTGLECDFFVSTTCSNTAVGLASGVNYPRFISRTRQKLDENVIFDLNFRLQPVHRFEGSNYRDWFYIDIREYGITHHDMRIKNQTLAYGIDDIWPKNIDGVLGVGPVGLTKGTVTSAGPNKTIPTVMNNLASQKVIKKQVLGIYFAPLSRYEWLQKSKGGPDGALTYGGDDPKLYKGKLTYTPVTKTLPAANYWGINITSATYGTHTVIPTSTAGIIDTNRPGVLLADDFFDVYLNAIPGANFDPETGLIEIPKKSISRMKPLQFTITNRVFTMDVAAQLIPKYQNEAWGGVAGKQYSVVVKLGRKSGTGNDFSLGAKFMERYYVVLDTDANRVGFAETKNTFTRLWPWD